MSYCQQLLTKTRTNELHQNCKQHNKNDECQTHQDDRHSEDHAVYYDSEHDSKHEVDHITPEVGFTALIIHHENKPRTRSEDNHKQNEFNHVSSHFKVTRINIERVVNSTARNAISTSI